MIVAQIGWGRVRHVVEFRPDLGDCWRSVCNRAQGGPGSLTTSSQGGADGLPGCALCIRMLRDRLAKLEG